MDVTRNSTAEERKAFALNFWNQFDEMEFTLENIQKLSEPDIEPAWEQIVETAKMRVIDAAENKAKRESIDFGSNVKLEDLFLAQKWFLKEGFGADVMGDGEGGNILVIEW